MRMMLMSPWWLRSLPMPLSRAGEPGYTRGWAPSVFSPCSSSLGAPPVSLTVSLSEVVQVQGCQHQGWYLLTHHELAPLHLSCSIPSHKPHPWAACARVSLAVWQHHWHAPAAGAACGDKLPLGVPWSWDEVQKGPRKTLGAVLPQWLS